MFARINAAALTIALAATSVAASPIEARTDSCNNGSVQCCHTMTDGGSPAASSLGALFGVPGTISGLVGMTCSPLTGGGLGANSCAQQTVCCTGNDYDGVLVIGCSPHSLQG
ncbi:fungal hydrophobin [Coprinellus micaceus]|uniref:Hydrophobin n=1 Tax=Coprinellus micaceus TaxID=71717 RepID=A0A4Y7RUQ7_COPMI|nr:fungal hydrophobin [Coprinellus micaceus]